MILCRVVEWTLEEIIYDSEAVSSALEFLVLRRECNM